MADPRRAAIAWMTLATLLWGVNFPVAKFAVAQLDPFFIAGVRIVTAALVFTAVLPRGSRGTVFRPRMLLVFLPLSLTGILINQVSFIHGILRTTPGHSAVIVALIPIFTAIVARVWLGEKLSNWGWLGIFLGAAGATGVMISGGRAGGEILTGDLITLIGPVAFAFYTVLGRRLVQQLGARVLTAGVYVCAAPFGIGLILHGAAQQDWSRVEWSGWVSLAYMSLVVTVICYFIYFWALKRLKAAQTAVFSDAQPVLGTGLSWGLKMEQPGPLFIASAAGALAGIALVQVRGKKDAEPLHPPREGRFDSPSGLC